MPSHAPNIILLIGEDTGLTLGCYGDPNASATTPNLDRLAARGIRYTRAITTSPVCAPSRSCLVTGRYPWSLGTHQMRSTLLAPPRLFTHELRDAGYFVNWHTKTDFNFDPDATPGPWRDAHHDWLPELAHGTLPHQPFFLYRNFSVTHESTMWDEGRHDGAWRERLHEARRLAPGQRHDPATLRVPPYLPDTPEVRTNLARYYDAMSIQDHQIGEVLAALDQSPYAANTIVIYLSDHGRGLPREKRWCYAAGVHLPLIVAGPGLAQGQVSDQLVNWPDLAPTILSLAGVAIPSHYQGQAFLGPAAASTPRAWAYFGRDRMDEAFDHVRGCCDARWHYLRNTFPKIPYAQRNHYMERMNATQVMRRMRAEGTLHGDAALWMADTKPPEELYDAVNDPAMVRNLAADPQHAPTLARMRAALDAHLAQVGDLGHGSERDLIARGLIKNRLDDEFAPLRGPLPPEYRLGPEIGPLTWEDAVALR